MFDEPFIPGSSNPWVTTPREGCAVFLSAIAGRRTDDEFLNEAIYTAIHELGHVVNLQHSSEPSFMATSAGRATSFALEDCEFDALEHGMLSQCSVSRFVWPGGSAFGDLGPFAVASNPIDASANPGEPLQLRIGMEQDSFWQFEPVELDIQLLLRSVGRSRASVPDMVDPGYRRFVIWIEEPTGERRRYLSPRHYCDHPGRVTVTSSAPIRRDVSIFGQSGGFCFQRTGLHRIFITFEVAPRRMIRSNTLEVFVRAPSASDYYTAAQRTMSDVDFGQLLYYRSLTSGRRRKLPLLEDLCEAFPKQAAVANVHYAIGRACARFSLDSRDNGLVRRASSHLRAAVRRKGLGDHRRAHAERVLESLPSLKAGRP